MTAEADPDAIGEDGFVRLRCYLRIADSHWFAAGCTGCGRQRDISVHEAIAAAGSGEATVGELAGRLRCTNCGERRIRITVAVDTRPAGRSLRRPMPRPSSGRPDEGAPDPST